MAPLAGANPCSVRSYKHATPAGVDGIFHIFFSCGYFTFNLCAAPVYPLVKSGRLREPDYELRELSFFGLKSQLAAMAFHDDVVAQR